MGENLLKLFFFQLNREQRRKQERMRIITSKSLKCIVFFEHQDDFAAQAANVFDNQKSKIFCSPNLFEPVLNPMSFSARQTFFAETAPNLRKTILHVRLFTISINNFLIFTYQVSFYPHHTSFRKFSPMNSFGNSFIFSNTLYFHRNCFLSFNSFHF